MENNIIQLTQQFINSNNIKSRKDFRENYPTEYGRFIRLTTKDDRINIKFLKEVYHNFTNEFLNKKDFQKFIEDNNILKPVDFKRNYPKIYDKLCRQLSSSEITTLQYPNKRNNYSEINTLEDLQKFIDNNQIINKKELHRYFPGIYVKFLKELDNVLFKKNNLSIGENFLKKLFDENKIKYVFQKTYKDLKNISLLRYDFYLPEYNVLVEHHGEAHFGKGRYFSENLLYNDKLKFDYANNNDIKLYYYTIYKSDYIKNGYFTEVIVDPNILLEKIRVTN